MSRMQYPAIINELADAKFITEAARNGSLELHTEFMSYKPRNRKIPDPAIASLEVLDRQLEQEFAKSGRVKLFPEKEDA